MVYHRLLRILFYQRSVSSTFCNCTNKKIKNNKETDRVLFLSNKEKLYKIPPSIYPGILYNFLRHFPQSTSGTNAKYTTFCWIFHRNTILLIEENGYYNMWQSEKKYFTSYEKLYKIDHHTEFGDKILCRNSYTNTVLISSKGIQSILSNSFCCQPFR